MELTTKTCGTWWAKIYISGPIEVAKQLLREECKRKGLCITIEPTDYIYTGGEETGYVVGLLNYPRFPVSNEALDQRAIEIAKMLRDRTFQSSVLVQLPNITHWFTDRE